MIHVTVIKMNILLCTKPVIKLSFASITFLSSHLNYCVISGMLCPVLDSPVQERYGGTGKSLAETANMSKALEHPS